MKKILVTGAGGFLGFEIAKLLTENKNLKVINISRTHHVKLDEIGVETIKCDISNKEQVSQIDLTDVEGIFHVAAIAGVWGKASDFYNVNFLGTKNLVDRAIESNIKHFIYTSTPSVVFGKDDIIAGDESLDYPEKYYTDYARTKSMAEKYVRSKSSERFRTISIRPHLIWGGGDPHLIPRVLEKARTGKLKIVGEGDNLVDIIYVKNAALAHLMAYQALLEKPELSGNCYFVGQERPVRLWDFINDILRRKNIRPLESSISYKAAYFVGFLLEKVFKFVGIYHPEPPMTRFVAMQLAKSHYFSHEKAKEDFGFEPKYSIEEALDLTFSQTPSSSYSVQK